MLGAINPVLSGAAAGEIEMAEAAGILTSTLAGFGMKGETVAETTANAARVMDVLAKASTSTKSSISTLGESLKSVSPIAKQFNFSLEDSVAMVAKMQDVGIEASEAGNAVKTMLTKLTKPSGTAAAIMKKAGVSFVDSFGNMKPPKELFAESAKLKKSLSGNAASAAAFAELVGLRGQKALMILGDMFSDTDKKGRTLADTLRDSKGFADQVAEVKLDNLNGDVVKLSSAWDGLTVAINDLLTPVLRPLIKEFTDFLGDPETRESIKFWTEKFIEWGPTMLTIASGVALVAGSIWAATAATAAWGFAVKAVNALFLLNPITAAIAAIIAGTILAIKHWDELKLAGALAIDAILAPAIFLQNVLSDILGKFGIAMGKIDQFGLSGSMMEQRDRQDTEAALDAARERKIQGGGGGAQKVEVGGGINITAPKGFGVSAKGKGGVGLNVAPSGGF
jgi:TP901 family phage tail tape measure protein